jgi:hypothetical protein
VSAGTRAREHSGSITDDADIHHVTRAGADAHDATTADAGPHDATTADAGPHDATTADAGPRHATTADAGPRHATTADPGNHHGVIPGVDPAIRGDVASGSSSGQRKRARILSGSRRSDDSERAERPGGDAHAVANRRREPAAARSSSAVDSPDVDVADPRSAADGFARAG